MSTETHVTEPLVKTKNIDVHTTYLCTYYVLRGTPYPKLQKFIQKITKTIFVPGTIPFSVGVLLRLNLNYKGSDIAQVRPNFVQKSYKRYFHYG